MRLRPLSITLCLVLAATLASVASVRADDPFTPGCTLPFASVAKTHPLDGSCPIEGEGSAESKLQNRAKNNFCVAGVPTSLTYQELQVTPDGRQQRKERGHDFIWVSHVPPG
jgi:hypothetical protein